jgi:hypothetical protein
MVILSILLPFGIFYGYLLYFVVILVYVSRFDTLNQEQSGNPAIHHPHGHYVSWSAIRLKNISVSSKPFL